VNLPPPKEVIPEEIAGILRRMAGQIEYGLSLGAVGGGNASVCTFMSKEEDTARAARFVAWTRENLGEPIQHP
jgi:hypothetical protein